MACVAARQGFQQTAVRTVTRKPVSPGYVSPQLQCICRSVRFSTEAASPAAPPSLSISPLEIARLPLLSFKGRVSVVSVPEDEQRVASVFEGVTLLGFDTESRPSTALAPKNRTALIQVATEQAACLWRVSDLKDLPPLLKSLIEDPSKHKVAQGASHELDVLREEFGIKPESFIDLHHIALHLRTTPRSLQGLVGIFLQKRLAKEQRLTDWERQTLTQAQIEYAAMDAWASRQVLAAMRTAFGVQRLDCEVLLGGPSLWRPKLTPTRRILASSEPVERLNLAEQASAATSSQSESSVVQSPPADKPDVSAQAHQSLAALCVARGYILRFEGFEPTSGGGFRCAFRVEYRRAGAAISEVFRSNRAHPTIRTAQNDAALEALAYLEALQPQSKKLTDITISS